MPKPRFFQQITYAAANIKAAQAELATLFGGGDFPIQLGNTQIAIAQAQQPLPADKAAVISGLVLHCDALNNVADKRGLNLSASKQAPEDVIPADPALPGIHTVDHVVLKTNNADDCIRLFRDDLGMRLALDQTVEAWGGRMLFFREGSMTLEVIEQKNDLPQQDEFWGVSYRAGDIRATVARLSERGVLVSEVRKGRKPGTEVASLKSHNISVETLLIGDSK